MPISASGLIWAVLLAFAALVVGSGIRLLSLRKRSDRKSQELRSSLVVWWVFAALFAAALMAGRVGVAVLFCTASLIALREFHSLFARRSFDSPLVVVILSALGVCHYGLVASGQLWSVGALSLTGLLVVTLFKLFSGETKDYLRTTAGYTWAYILIVIGLSHIVLLTFLPAPINSLGFGSMGWCIFLVLLTEINDISQALLGRQLGRTRLAAAVSPGKTLEGLLGGLVVTILLSTLLSPVLTTLTIGKTPIQAAMSSAVVGVLISIGGFLGDLNMSGLKREAGVKDSSDLLPGMGGMIDRIDSLTVTAPAFYIFSTLVS